MDSAFAVIGVDIGTSSARAVAYDRDGRVLASEAREYPLRSPLPGRAEQSPDGVLEALLHSLARVARACEARVSGVAFSAAMHGLIGLDPEGRPVTPLITFADNRASEQARRVREEMDGLAIHRRTDTPIHPMSPLAKLLWFREEDPDRWRRAARWVWIKEYLLFRLFGEFVVDHSIASATGLFELERLHWDEEVLRLLELPEERLSRPGPATHAMAGLEPAVADRLGLDPGTPFGVGAVDPGVVACSIGTSGAYRAAGPAPGARRRGTPLLLRADREVRPLAALLRDSPARRSGRHTRLHPSDPEAGRRRGDHRGRPGTGHPLGGDRGRWRPVRSLHRR
ncbi:MAG TPA: FGGY family carbohydrate kinase [Rubrobacteraceae bacterium]|nr:FGGY family carbohydrate kinase [Rubrobacteraceae bacterium]